MKNGLSVLPIVGCIIVALNAMSAELLSLASGSNAEALTHNERGMTFYQDGKYMEALKHFDASEDFQRTSARVV